MNRKRNLRNAAVFALLLLLVCAQQAEAYIDPGSGSYILQLIVAGLLGAGVAVKIYWKRIRSSISRVFSRGQGEVDETE